MSKLFCVDCKHCDEMVFPPRPGLDMSTNKWRYRCTNESVIYVDLVTGKPARPTCKDARAIGGPCAPHGCYFEVRIERNVLDINQVTSDDLEKRSHVD